LENRRVESVHDGMPVYGRGAVMKGFLLVIPFLLLSCATSPHQRPPEYWNEQGFAHREAGEYGKAEAAFKEAIRLAPESEVGYNNLGRLYFVRGRYEEAAESFEKAAELQPSAGIYRNLGASYARLGRYERAVVALRRAIAINPEDAEAYRDLGVVYILSSDMKSALEQHEILRKLDPGKAEELFRMMYR
jgi:Flp pilus assembly protein TadD